MTKNAETPISDIINHTSVFRPAYWMPSTIWRWAGPFASRRTDVVRIARSAARTGRNVAALTVKASPSPTATTSRPATAGPAVRATLNIVELRAMALVRSSLPTISTTNACRAGTSSARPTPKMKASAITCHTWTKPVTVSVASVAAWTNINVCARRTRRFLSKRSASEPAQRPIGSAGTRATKFTRPSIAGEPVRRYTSQFCATNWIHVPTSETIWLNHHRRKSRWRSERKVRGSVTRRRRYSPTALFLRVPAIHF